MSERCVLLVEPSPFQEEWGLTVRVMKLGRYQEWKSVGAFFLDARDVERTRLDLLTIRATEWFRKFSPPDEPFMYEDGSRPVLLRGGPNDGRRMSLYEGQGVVVEDAERSLLGEYVATDELADGRVVFRWHPRSG